MKQTLLLATALIAMTVMTGCFRTTFTYSDRAAGAVTETKQKYLIGGLIGPDKPFRADQLCPSGVAGVETYQTVGNVCVGMCTLNIYTPKTIKVTCSAGGAHNFYLDDQDNVLAHERVSVDGSSVMDDFTSSAL